MRAMPEAIHEKLAVGQAGQIIMHGIMQQALLGVAQLGHVGERADDA